MFLDPDLMKLKPSLANQDLAAAILAQIPRAQLASRGITLDANDLTSVFARELEWIDQEIMREEFAPLKGEQLIPYYGAGGSGVNQVTYRKVTELGEAKFIGDGTTRLPRVDVVGTEYTTDVKNLGVAYAYTIFQLMNVAENPTIRLDVERKRAAAAAARRLHDRTAMAGNDDFGWTGFINDPNVPIVTAITGDWANAATTALEKVADVDKLTWSVYEATKELYEASILAIPTSLGVALAQPIGVDANKTALKFILDNSAHVKKIETTHYLETASATNGNRIVAYSKTPDVLRYGANEMFAEEPPQRVGLEIEVPCHGRSSGLQVRKPLAMAYMDLT